MPRGCSAPDLATRSSSGGAPCGCTAHGWANAICAKVIMTHRGANPATGRTVVIADDHAVVLEGLQRLLEDEFDIVGTATDGRELLSVVLSTVTDVVVTDISMSELDGIDALQCIRR